MVMITPEGQWKKNASKKCTLCQDYICSVCEFLLSEGQKEIKVNLRIIGENFQILNFLYKQPDTHVAPQKNLKTFMIRF